MVKLLLWKKTDIIGTLLHTLDLCLHILHWYTVLILAHILLAVAVRKQVGAAPGRHAKR